MSSYPSSNLAYPHLNQLLDSLLPISVSSTSSTFTLSSVADSSPLPAASLDSSTPSDQLPPITNLLSTFAAITQTMMTAMIKSTNSHPDSDDSDSPNSPLAKNQTLSSNHNSRQPKYHTQIKTKILNLKNKSPMLRSSPPSSPIKPPSSSILHSNPNDHTQSFNVETSSPPPPNYNSHLLPHNNLSPRPPQLSSLSSPLYLHNSLPPDDTNCDNSSTDSPIHNPWQSTKIYPPTPPPIKTNDIPLTSVNNIFDPPDSPVKVYSSCRFPPE